MKLSIEFPQISPAIEGGTVSHWHKRVGDQVSYGDDLFDIAIEEVTRMRRRLGAKVRKPSKAKYRKLSDIRVIYRVTSMDTGTLSDIAAPEGTPITVGDVVAHLDTGDGSESTAVARTTFNLVPAGTEASA